MQAFDTMPDGREIEEFVLSNEAGVTVSILELGGIIRRFLAPDRHGAMADIVLGHDSAEAYLTRSPYFGAVVGRYANRIANAKFTLDGTEYTLVPHEDTPHHLHGGKVGFDKRLWHGEAFADERGQGVRLTLHSPNGDEGYPGALDLIVIYRLADDGTLSVQYEAATSAPTVVNLTQHSYFNLAGHDGGSIGEHILQMPATTFTPVDADLIPTGNIQAVAATPLDFTVPKPIGRDIDSDHPQMQLGQGYDHNFVINPEAGLAQVATVTEPVSGRQLVVRSDRPGVQLYTGNHLDGSIAGKGGVKYRRRGAFCLETQYYPDSPNQPEFPSSVLRPGELFASTTTFQVGVDS